MSQSSAVTALQLELVSPEKTQEREEYLLSGSHHITPLPPVSPEDTRDVNTGEPGPRELKCTSKGWFQWAQTLAASHTQKSTSFLTWTDLVSLINSNLFMSRLPALFLQTPHMF